MKWIALLLFLICFYSQSLAQETMMLEKYSWENRIILLFGETADESLLHQQYEELQADPAGLSERDLIVFQILSDRVLEANVNSSSSSAQKLREQYQISEGEFCVVLIGKDGSEKLRSNKLLRRNILYDVIDAMPMRRRERDEDKG